MAIPWYYHDNTASCHESLLKANAAIEYKHADAMVYSVASGMASPSFLWCVAMAFCDGHAMSMPRAVLVRNYIWPCHGMPRKTQMMYCRSPQLVLPAYTFYAGFELACNLSNQVYSVLDATCSAAVDEQIRRTCMLWSAVSTKCHMLHQRPLLGKTQFCKRDLSAFSGEVHRYNTINWVLCSYMGETVIHLESLRVSMSILEIDIVIRCSQEYRYCSSRFSLIDRRPDP